MKTSTLLVRTIDKIDPAIPKYIIRDLRTVLDSVIAMEKICAAESSIYRKSSHQSRYIGTPVESIFSGIFSDIGINQG